MGFPGWRDLRIIFWLKYIFFFLKKGISMECTNEGQNIIAGEGGKK